MVPARAGPLGPQPRANDTKYARAARAKPHVSWLDWATQPVLTLPRPRFGSKRSPVQIRPPRLIDNRNSNNDLPRVRRSTPIDVSRIWGRTWGRLGLRQAGIRVAMRIESVEVTPS